MFSVGKTMKLAASAALFISTPVLADEIYNCKHGGQERTIKIAYTTQGSNVPCEVTYTKENGETQSLWQAQNIAGYCEEKTAQFIEKQKGWGWDCAKQ